MMTGSAELATFLASSNEGHRADLITVTMRDGTIYRWTTAPMALLVGGQTYLSTGTGAPIIRRGPVKRSARLTIDTLDLELEGFSIGGSPIGLLSAQGLFNGARVSIEPLTMPTPGDTSLDPVSKWFEGRVAGVSPRGVGVALTLKSELEACNVLVPRFLLQPQCSNVVYDANCGLSRAAWTSALVVAAATTKTIQISATSMVTQTYDTPGAHSWTAPAGVSKVTVQAWGGGGGGGGAPDLGVLGYQPYAGGGGGGAYATGDVVVSPGVSYAIVVGGGGSGGADADGSPGEDSTFNATSIIAKGGSGGGQDAGSEGSGGAGGIAVSSVGTTRYAGGDGAGGSGLAGYSGSGGSSAGTAGIGTDGAADGLAATAPAGGGNGGAGSGGSGPPDNGVAPGGGGGGTATASQPGGDGAVGKVILSGSWPVSAFDLGVLKFTSGALSGKRYIVQSFDGSTLTLAKALPSTPSVGDTFEVYPGCDRSRATCDGRFHNLAQHRGYPHIPRPEGA